VYDSNQLHKFKEKSFDIITLWHVLEHLQNLEMHIYRLEKLLKRNGRIIVAVPNYKSYDAAYYKSFWAAYDVPRHLWHFTKDAIKRLFFRYDMEVEKILPMKFDAFYVSLLSEKYKNGKSNYFKSFWIGLLSNIKAVHTKEYSSLIYIIKKV
ncbi:MAG: class I SAM-dependent methyltransferase, partial [Bacteroidia bacterium]|nr:class I SAM-dependent methyltransferase [Bacteroidia bacterium]